MLLFCFYHQKHFYCLVSFFFFLFLDWAFGKPLERNAEMSERAFYGGGVRGGATELWCNGAHRAKLSIKVQHASSAAREGYKSLTLS